MKSLFVGCASLFVPSFNNSVLRTASFLPPGIAFFQKFSASSPFIHPLPSGNSVFLNEGLFFPFRQQRFCEGTFLSASSRQRCSPSLFSSLHNFSKSLCPQNIIRICQTFILLVIFLYRALLSLVCSARCFRDNTDSFTYQHHYISIKI